MNAPHQPSPTLLDLAGRSVPRYTSYPTAPHFTSAVEGTVYGGWLDQVQDRGEPISLYLHVPFCRTICTYCGCSTKATLRDDPIRAYADTMRQEIRLLADRLGPVEVEHLHWGGGTPSILPPDCLEMLVRELSDRFRFRQDMKHAIELDPRHVTAEGARQMAGLGINRASLGVQTLDADVQEAIGRIQPLPVVAAAFQALRDAGITAINADLMYGLPLQTCQTIRETARQTLALEPTRLAIFGYAHVPWMKSHQKLIDPTALPGIAERIRQATAARKSLLEGGFVEIGIDHFARPEDGLAVAFRSRTLRRNFQGYTVDGAETLIGIGASSISRTPFGYAQNAADVHGWRRAIKAGQFATRQGKAFEGEDRMRAAVISDLLCFFEFDLVEVSERHGFPAQSLAADVGRLAPLVQAGWVEIDGSRIAIRSQRHEVARIVASEFDSYLGHGGRHSSAV
ncbi:oxygen-independent coproporphyrinogen III oxidase [Aurantimonas sp. A2-1-M11]|uniref:oxygen-independent coproporphyrinogen III oxidase n=1 Tax=Aurantimonas sp. A2-1-M11 TaxID=3113712 RepID=UPI002F950DC0